MAISKQLSRAKRKVIARWFPDVSDATAETIEILMDIEQVSDILSSFDDIRHNRLLSMDKAFGDL